MNSSLETSEDYLKLWHAYLDYLRRSMLVNYERESDESKKETVAETLRETFQKAINQLYECTYNFFSLFFFRFSILFASL